MRADILIVGQGIAGTMLAWEFERAGISFEIVDRGHAMAATCAGAGIINPITGRRLVKSWRVDALLPVARAAYRDLEAALGVALWRDLRVRRLFADEAERRTFLAKRATGELVPFVEGDAADENGFWIETAARVDVAALLAAARARWLAQGRLIEAALEDEIDSALTRGRYDLVIDCRGFESTHERAFDFVPWEFSKGELLEITVDGLDPGIVLNRRHWIVPMSQGIAWVGATHESGKTDRATTAAGRATLAASTGTLLGEAFPFVVSGHRAGVRVNLPDKLPVAGRCPENPGVGLINGLGAKGVLFAPWLARQWLNHVTEGVPFDPAINVRRFV
jgi:glycine oxidase